MIIKREENWGILRYDTLKHCFSYVKNDKNEATPYIRNPVLLNLYLTMKCNLTCMHCVTKDFPQLEDFVVSTEMIKWINKSPFLVVVITGGEPFLPEYEDKLITLLKNVHRKGLIVDTNGTIKPSKSLIHAIIENNILVRISWDSVRVQDEIYFRHIKSSTLKNLDLNKEYFQKKIHILKWFRTQGVNVAVQSVIHSKNQISITDFPNILHKFSIKKWYLQRFIPSYRATEIKKFGITNEKYDEIITSLIEKCNPKNIECIAKKDRRHNSVFLLVGHGLLYTQGEQPGQKIPLGKINNKISYFDYVSSPDHSERYYG